MVSSGSTIDLPRCLLEFDAQRAIHVWIDGTLLRTDNTNYNSSFSSRRGGRSITYINWNQSTELLSFNQRWHDRCIKYGNQIMRCRDQINLQLYSVRTYNSALSMELQLLIDRSIARKRGQHRFCTSVRDRINPRRKLRVTYRHRRR